RSWRPAKPHNDSERAGEGQVDFDYPLRGVGRRHSAMRIGLRAVKSGSSKASRFGNEIPQEKASRVPRMLFCPQPSALKPLLHYAALAPLRPYRPMNAILPSELPAAAGAARAAMTNAYCRDETEAVNELLAQAALPPHERDLVLTRASELVARVRAKAHE